MTEWVVGIDLGGTKTALGLINPQDEIVAYRRIPTNAGKGPEDIIERIADCVMELEREISGGQSVAGVGVCAPGPLDYVSGVLINPTNLPRFYNTPLRQMLEDRLGLPISLEHDAKAAALGEFHYGAGRGESSMVYIVVGTGVGAAIILDGRLARGARNFAGEVGHITIDRYGELCPCGSRGCVDTYSSGPWLARRYLRAYKTEGALPEVTGADVARLAEEGDPLAVRIIRDAGEALGIAIATMAMILDVELYIIGGSVARSGDLLLDPARWTAPRYSFLSVGPHMRIVAAELGDDGPILGAGRGVREVIHC